MLFNRRKLPTTQETMDAFADSFLASNGFEVNDAMRAMVGSYIQHSDERKDSINVKALASAIRKQQANVCAFYLIKPDRRPVKEEPAAEPGNEQG